jgi:pimeloyl-ACP methyl ester carboxylesterase
MRTATESVANEPLLLLPGMMCDARLFTAQVDEFSVNREVLVGTFGEHSSISAMAEEILDTAAPRFALAGLSMGGIVAMEMLRQAPDRLTRLALLDTNPLADLPKQVELRDAQVKRVQTGRLSSVMRDEMKPNYLADGPRSAAILELCMAMAEELGPDVFVSQSRALQTRRDQQETLQNVTVPTLILCGEHDSLCPLQRHELMRDLVPNAKLAVISGAGHLPTLEQPELTNRELATWLAA